MSLYFRSLLQRSRLAELQGNHIWVEFLNAAGSATQISSPVIPRVIAMRKSRVSPPLQLLIPSRKNLRKNRRREYTARDQEELHNRVPYHRARVRSNEVGRNNAEEGGREDLPKTGKNDERFEETVKERSRGLDASRTESRSDAGRRNVGEERGEAGQSLPTNSQVLSRRRE